MKGVLDVLGLTLQDLHMDASGTLLARVEERLVSAWSAFANGEAGIEDAQIILVDLASYSGYYGTADFDASDAQLHNLNGRRAVFQRIAEALVITGVTLDGLHGAVIRNPTLE